MDDVVKITTYITDLAYRALVAGPRDRYLGTPGPASTLVVVKGLAAPEYLVEIEALAILD
jgi:2-iminobutanoate/2-iminopropanoate deaminase